MCARCVLAVSFRTPSLLITPTLDANQSVSESQREHLFLISLVATSVWQAGRLSNTFACLLLSSCLVHLLIHLPQTLTHTCPSLLISDFFAVRAAKILPTSQSANITAAPAASSGQKEKRRDGRPERPNSKSTYCSQVTATKSKLTAKQRTTK